MIDIQTERLVTLAEATRILPGRPSISTLWRWRHKGVGGRRLETVRIGGKRFTSREAIARFARQDGDAPTSAGRSTSDREKAIRAAERELSAEGV